MASRDELVQLAAARALRRHQFPTDRGQPWSVWALEYARALFEVMTMDGQLFESWLSGGQSPMVEVDAAEWLRALTRRSLSGAEALQLRRAVSNLVIGATKAVLSRPPEDLFLLRQFVDIFAREITEDSWGVRALPPASRRDDRARIAAT